ncbi:hypothetical protein [Methanolobus sp. WCC5]|uniref:hypothetical protein n=1 Tax=Methanolobus sp. WCC5 TaxID=3125785 RepID=UPI00325305AF
MSGCTETSDSNVASGSYTLEGNEITISPGLMTLAYCGPDSGQQVPCISVMYRQPQ